ncbi:MAG: hypothetical protein QXI54_05330 [Archaeoglobaceae archaeon]
MSNAVKLVIGFAVLIFCLVPIIPVDVTYTAVEPYYRECQYEVVSATLRQSWDLSRGVYHISEITIKNIDSSGGTFTVTHKLYDIKGLYGTKITSEYLSPGQTKTFRAEFDTRWLQDVRGEYSVSAPTIIDQRLVTKHNTVYKSLIGIIVSR